MAKKSGLGRGLNALISEANAETGNEPEAVLSISEPKSAKKDFS